MAAPEPEPTRPRSASSPSDLPRSDYAHSGQVHPGPARLARVPAEADAQLGADLAAVRRGYGGGRLDESDLASTWLEQFAHWFADAAAPGSGVLEPNAMVFATADAAGRPSARTVLLKGFGAEGFLLFTNYTSRKGRESAANPHGSLVFPWYSLERQVIVVGTVERVSVQRSAEYFHSRPRGSQLGAWASHQSAVLSSREELERRDAELVERWPPGTSIPVPPFWGGLLVVPETVEFWQGRPDRLHDRLRYRRTAPLTGRPASAVAADDSEGRSTKVDSEEWWTVERLAP